MASGDECLLLPVMASIERYVMPAVQTSFNWRRSAGHGLMLLLAGLLGGCGKLPVSVQDLNASYERALVRTAPLAVVRNPAARQRVAFDRLRSFHDGRQPRCKSRR
jgi:hypothetical protein